MIQTPKILGQDKPQPLAQDLLYTAASGHQVQLSVFMANQSSSYEYYSIALVPYGQVESNSSWLAFNAALPANSVCAYSGVYLNGGDSIYVSSIYGNCSFTATGIDFTSEIY